MGEGPVVRAPNHGGPCRESQGLWRILGLKFRPNGGVGLHELEKAQEKREFVRAIGPVAAGLFVGLLVTTAWLALDSAELIGADAVIQVIPVLLIAVILEGGVVAFPRLTRRPRKVLYEFLFGTFVIVLLLAIGAAIVDWQGNPRAAQAMQLVAVTAGSVTVAGGFLFHSLGSLLPLEISVVERDSDRIVFTVGASNRYRARNITPLLNVLVPAGSTFGECDSRGRWIDPGPDALLHTEESIRDCASPTKWTYASKEFGISAGDNRIGYFRLHPPAESPDPIPVVARADHQDLKSGRQQTIAFL